ncbi:hypothetical protein SAMN04488688_112110 [Paenibacillus sp. cl141a]|uniref:hypothetical protein n=1 Tax=Paenibacillus sp. cl141a TaxID=1761877 RepID=UPI0008D329DF|nr:hypothetical protein [Paenibacillus sp. cl141a]SEM38966.1 hypothetical protein SAMN04488688_112110 [Paenibacillus sp. cl141a]
MKRKLLGLIGAVVLVFGLFPATVGATSGLSPADIDTPEEYIQYLEERAEAFSNFSIANNSDEETPLEFLEKFKALPYEKQKEFVDIISDPEKVNEIVTGFQVAAEEKGTLVIHDGATEIRIDEQNEISPAAVGDVRYYTARVNPVSTVQGLDVVQATIYVRYEVKEVKTNYSEIVGIVSHGCEVVKNYIPLLDLSIKESNPYTSDNKRKIFKYATMKWNFIWKEFGMVVGTHELHTWGDVAGNSGGDSRQL